MSNSPSPQNQDHESSQTSAWLVIAIVLAFVVPLALVAKYVNNEATAADAAVQEEAVAGRIQPIGAVTIEAVTQGGPPKTGEEVFKGTCSGCHAAGTLGAPKFGDHAAWGPRIAQGFETLWHSALKGKNAMPPQGGGALSDLEVARGVVYMANAGGAKFEEPKAPEAAASGAAAASK